MIKLIGLAYLALGAFGTYGFTAASIGSLGTSYSNNLWYLVPLALASAEIARAGLLQVKSGKAVEPFGWIGS